MKAIVIAPSKEKYKKGADNNIEKPMISRGSTPGLTPSGILEL